MYQICSICLGTPPATFDWEYKDKDDKYVCHDNISPLQFYEQFVKPVFDMADKVSQSTYIITYSHVYIDYRF